MITMKARDNVVVGLAQTVGQTRSKFPMLHLFNIYKSGLRLLSNLFKKMDIKIDSSRWIYYNEFKSKNSKCLVLLGRTCGKIVTPHWLAAGQAALDWSRQN